MKKILYITNNDGSDMRVVKEVQTLSHEFEVHFIGIGEAGGKNFAREFCAKFSLARGKIRSPITIVKFLASILSHRLAFKYNSIHVVDEQIFAICLPLLSGAKIVLDIFDSMFLRRNWEGEKVILLKRILYGACDKIIVTDEKRFELLPRFAMRKSSVIPNVPRNTLTAARDKVSSKKFVVAYFGTLAESRGSFFLKEMLKNKNVEAICAGWVVDKFTEDLLTNPKVSYLGILPQTEANNVIKSRADCILSIYPTTNLNNYYASPNKIYDSIHTQVPILISDNVLVSSFVSDMKIGEVVDPSNPKLVNFCDIIDRLRDIKISDELKNDYCWENFELSLLSLHN